jgi:hypothetical protein
VTPPRRAPAIGNEIGPSIPEYPYIGAREGTEKGVGVGVEVGVAVTFNGGGGFAINCSRVHGVNAIVLYWS